MPNYSSLSIERKAPLIKENSELERCGTSESVWCSQVYITNQQLTTNKGPTYIPIMGKIPYLSAKIISKIITAATPISEIQTFLAHTLAIRKAFNKAYLFNPDPIHKALWNIACNCIAVKSDVGEGRYIWQSSYKKKLKTTF